MHRLAPIEAPRNREPSTMSTSPASSSRRACRTASSTRCWPSASKVTNRCDAGEDPGELDARLQGRALTHVDGVVDEVGAGLEDLGGGGVAAAVVDAHDLVGDRQDAGDHAADDLGLVVHRHDERHVSHAAQYTGGCVADTRPGVPPDYGERRAQATTRAAGPTGPAPPRPLRQARAAALHQPPRLQPGLRARRLPRPGADGVLLGLQPAPAHLLRRCGTDRLGERGGVPRAGAGPGGRAGRRPRACSTRRCRPAWTSSRWSSRRADRCPTCSRAAGGASTWPSTATSPDAVTRFLAADEALVERMTKKGMREFDARGAVVALALVDAGRRRRAGRTTLDVVLRHGTPAVRPDDVLRGLDHRGRARRRARPR